MRSSASAWRRPRPRRTRCGLPLYRYVGGVDANLLPVPMMNILNGGVHADNGIDFQEFMVMPVGAPSFRRGAALRRRDFPRAEERAAPGGPVDRGRRRGRLRAGHRLGARGARLHREGGRARPATSSATTCCSRSIARRANIFKDGAYRMEGEGKTPVAGREWPTYLAELAADYPIASIEDGMAEDDWRGLEGADRQARRPGPAGRRRSVRDQREAAAARASTTASPIRS